MNPRELGFLLLTCHFGNPDRRVLSPAQMRTLSYRIANLDRRDLDRDLSEQDLVGLGYSRDMAKRIVALLDEEDLLDAYLRRGMAAGCLPISWASEIYPDRLRRTLGFEAPGCLWARGDLSLLGRPGISLVGSRDINKPANRSFAAQVGVQAAAQGFVLVSGNARGTDKIGQNACLQAGGAVIAVVADELDMLPCRKGVLYLSEDGYSEPFSSVRALSRNRCIHALGEKTFVAQSSHGLGGTWDGTVKNLRFHWSPVFVFSDGTDAMAQLQQMGADFVEEGQLSDLSGLCPSSQSLFEK